MAELEYLRDIGYPFLLQRLNRREVLLIDLQRPQRGERAPGQGAALRRRRTAARPAIGGLAGLHGPGRHGRKKTAEEKPLRDAVAKDSRAEGRRRRLGHDRRGCRRSARPTSKRYTMLEGGAGFNSELFGIARTLVRAAEECAKPNERTAARVRATSDLESLELQALLRASRSTTTSRSSSWPTRSTWLAEQLGDDDRAGAEGAGRQVAARAGRRAGHGHEAARTSAVRKKLYEGGKEAIDASQRPDDRSWPSWSMPTPARCARSWRTQVDEPKQQAYAKIAKAKFAVEGTSTYPDATFTLRLAFGAVKGYEEDGKKIPFETTFAGLYERAEEHDNKPPFDLPQRWVERKDKLNLKTPFNFVCTADIIGGNSGSPVVNRDGEVVGLIFDGNIQSLVLDFVYTEEQARAVSVASRGIIEALRKVYDAEELANEIATGKR